MAFQTTSKLLNESLCKKTNQTNKQKKPTTMESPAGTIQDYKGEVSFFHFFFFF